MHLTTLWMLSPMTPETGTILLPRTHRRPTNPSVPGAAADFAGPLAPHRGELSAVGPAGAVLVCDSRLWHAVPSNPSDTPRVAVVRRVAPRRPLPPPSLPAFPFAAALSLPLRFAATAGPLPLLHHCRRLAIAIAARLCRQCRHSTWRPLGHSTSAEQESPARPSCLPPSRLPLLPAPLLPAPPACASCMPALHASRTCLHDIVCVRSHARADVLGILGGKQHPAVPTTALAGEYIYVHCHSIYTGRQTASGSAHSSTGW